jgi:hypothetical protein
VRARPGLTAIALLAFLPLAGCDGDDEAPQPAPPEQAPPPRSVQPPPGASLGCGARNQRACAEAPAPGIELTLTGPQNPRGLEPLTRAPTPDRPLWPRVRGHKPYGFNAVSAGRGGTTVEDEAFLHRQMGASMTRIGADWSLIQYFPNAGAGGRPWDYGTHLDGRYMAYIREGIRPILTIARTPRRFTANAATQANSNVVGCGTSDSCWNPPRPRQLPRLASFAADLARRYPLAAGIEVWNEPNISNPFWGGEPLDPEYFVRMLRTVHRAVRGIRPAMPVIAGGIANHGETFEDEQGYEVMSLRDYLAGMLEAGAQPYMDAVSFHPYPGSFAVSSDAQGKSEELVEDAYEDAGKTVSERFVATEFGASTTDGYSDAAQRDQLVAQYEAYDTGAGSVPLSDRIDAAFVHEAVENPQAQAGNAFQVGFGLTRVKDARGRFATKRAYCAFRTTFGGFARCPAKLRPR